MTRSMFTSVSGMTAQWNNMNVISNNLANIDKTAFKRDTTLFKAFPEMLIRRMNDTGVVRIPLGSYDTAPIVGKIGTGVEVNDIHTQFEQGTNLKNTGNDLDVALNGRGFFVVQDDKGRLLYTRNGEFQLDKDSFLVNKDGFYVLGESNKPIQIKTNNFKITEEGQIIENDLYPAKDLSVFIDKEQNGWENEMLVDRFLVVNFQDERFMKKLGNSNYVPDNRAGERIIMDHENGRPQVLWQYLETSNVNPVIEMVKMIEVHRHYEANQKALMAADQLNGHAVNELAKA